MKLNYDCIRDILLAIENTTTYDKSFEFPEIYEELKNYSGNEIMYHIRQLNLSGMLYKTTFHSSGVIVMDLDPEGHKFLNDIRGEDVWEKTKETATKVGGVSLSGMAMIAGEVAKQYILGQLGLK